MYSYLSYFRRTNIFGCLFCKYVALEYIQIRGIQIYLDICLCPFYDICSFQQEGLPWCQTCLLWCHDGLPWCQVYYGIRKVYHSIRKVYHDVRKVYQGVRKVNHDVRKVTPKIFQDPQWSHTTDQWTNRPTERHPKYRANPDFQSRWMSTMVSGRYNMVSGRSTMASVMSTMVSGRSTMVTGNYTIVSGRSTMMSARSTTVSGRSTMVSGRSTTSTPNIFQDPPWWRTTDQGTNQPTKQHPKYRANPDFQSRGEFKIWSLPILLIVRLSSPGGACTWPGCICRPATTDRIQLQPRYVSGCQR